ncbi:MAG: hypothetical protein LUE26_09115 [Alistipes sp.]|nr:hypothetical protein [Alistipes sp.]
MLPEDFDTYFNPDGTGKDAPYISGSPEWSKWNKNKEQVRNTALTVINDRLAVLREDRRKYVEAILARGDGSIKDLRDAFLPKYRKEHKTLVLIRGELREEKIRVNFLEGMERRGNGAELGRLAGD